MATAGAHAAEEPLPEPLPAGVGGAEPSTTTTGGLSHKGGGIRPTHPARKACVAIIERQTGQGSGSSAAASFSAAAAASAAAVSSSARCSALATRLVRRSRSVLALPSSSPVLRTCDRWARAAEEKRSTAAVDGEKIMWWVGGCGGRWSEWGGAEWSQHPSGG